MPHVVNLEGVRGDGFERNIPLLTGPLPGRLLTLDEMSSIVNTYPLIRMQVRKRAGAPEVVIELSSLNSELVYLSASSELKITFSASKALSAGDFVYDVQFSGPGVEPFTLFGGKLTLLQDITDAPTVI